VRSRIMTIAFREGLKLTPNVIDQFVEGTHADIRQILNLLSTYRLSKDELAFDESKKVYPSPLPPLSVPLGVSRV
jgi:replication factor C subunit 1